MILYFFNCVYAQDFRQCKQMVFLDEVRPKDKLRYPSVCAPGTLSVDGKCTDARKALENFKGKSCSTSNDCIIRGDFESGETTPIMGTLLECIEKTCQLPIWEGLSCKSDDECITKKCSKEGICIRAPNGDSCDKEPISCELHSRCTAEGACVRKSTNYEVCTETTDCDEGFFCSKDVHICMPRVHNGERCDVAIDSQCVAGSFCRKQSCCGGEDGKSYCEHRRERGAYCEDHSWCAGFEDSTGFCVAKRCVHMPLHLPGKVLDPCSSSLGCQTGNVCVKGICRRQYEASCETQEDCGQSSCFCTLTSLKPEGNISTKGTCIDSDAYSCDQEYSDLQVCIRHSRADNPYRWGTSFAQVYDPACCAQLNGFVNCIRSQISSRVIPSIPPEDISKALGSVMQCDEGGISRQTLAVILGSVFGSIGLLLFLLICVIIIVACSCGIGLCIGRRRNASSSKDNLDVESEPVKDETFSLLPSQSSSTNHVD